MHGNSLPPDKGILRVSMIMILIAFIGYFSAFRHKFSNISRHSCRLIHDYQHQVEIELRSIQDPVEIKSRSR